MREDGTPTNVNDKNSNLVRTVAPQRLFADTNLVTQPRGYNESLSFSGSTRTLFNYP